MKSKDIFYLVLAVVIFLGAGYLGYTQLVPKQSSTGGVQVEVVGAIPAQMDPAALAMLKDASKVVDYNSPVDLGGLDNTAVFGK